MKRFLIGVLLTLTTCISFANSRVADWDKPLHPRRFTDPTIDGIDVVKLYTNGNLAISFYAEGDDGTHNNWKATFSVRTYTRVGWNHFEWVYMIYDVPVYSQYPSGLGYGEYVIPGYNQYVWEQGGNPGPSGNYLVDASQYSVVYWGPK